MLLKNIIMKKWTTSKQTYDFASYLHDGQIRQSGELYITYPLNVAYILAEMHADRDTLWLDFYMIL